MSPVQENGCRDCRGHTLSGPFLQYLLLLHWGDQFTPLYAAEEAMEYKMFRKWAFTPFCTLAWVAAARIPRSIHLIANCTSRPSCWDRKLPIVQCSDDGYYVWCIIMIPNYRHQHQPRQGQLDTWVHLITPGHRHQTADWRESSFCAVHHLQSCELWWPCSMGNFNARHCLNFPHFTKCQLDSEQFPLINRKHGMMRCSVLFWGVLARWPVKRIVLCSIVKLVNQKWW